jgi:hypothetical protein
MKNGRFGRDEEFRHYIIFTIPIDGPFVNLKINKINPILVCDYIIILESLVQLTTMKKKGNLKRK